MRAARRLGVAVALAGIAMAIAKDRAGAQPAQPAPPANDARVAAGRQSFLEVARVLQSPRCLNCHPVGDRPLRGDHAGFHAMNVSRRSPEAGLQCTACHRSENAPFPGGPPGVPDWHMPPADKPMVFQGKTPGDLCRILVDPAQNGNRTPQAIFEHIAGDKLVLWGWNPGPGRTLPPLSHAETVRHARAWVDAGAPCPP